MSYPHHIHVYDDQRTLSIYPEGAAPIIVNGDHPNYTELVEEADKGTMDLTTLRGLASPATSISDKFKVLSDRVSVRGGKIYFDDDQVHNTLTNHIVRCLKEDAPFSALVNFMERIATNPNEHSRDSLYDWLSRGDFTILEDGRFVGYKGVRTDEKGALWSTTRGNAVVDGEEIVGYIPNKPGTTVSMPRSEVTHDPSKSCSTGLHVGTHPYAESYAESHGDTLLKVLVDPRDVVSVPNHEHDKMRVCRYYVEGPADDQPEREAVRLVDEPHWEPDLEPTERDSVSLDYPEIGMIVKEKGKDRAPREIEEVHPYYVGIKGGRPISRKNLVKRYEIVSG